MITAAGWFHRVFWNEKRGPRGPGAPAGVRIPKEALVLCDWVGSIRLDNFLDSIFLSLYQLEVQLFAGGSTAQGCKGAEQWKRGRGCQVADQECCKNVDDRSRNLAVESLREEAWFCRMLLCFFRRPRRVHKRGSPFSRKDPPSNLWHFLCGAFSFQQEKAGSMRVTLPTNGVFSKRNDSPPNPGTPRILISFRKMRTVDT